MTALGRVAFIGNSLPRRCGIATFTTDLQQAVAASRADLETVIAAMTDRGRVYDYPSTVGFQIQDGCIEDYVSAAEFLNAGHFDVVCLQHEFGIYGGEAGEHIDLGDVAEEVRDGCPRRPGWRERFRDRAPGSFSANRLFPGSIPSPNGCCRHFPTRRS